ncbi:hypothetical protein [Prescottella equi]|nr:hypothetical protein [Prescottella equi]
MVEEVEEEGMVWGWKGEKGYVEGAVRFDEVRGEVRRVVVVVE